ncbi:unnamed protein product [Lactuca virosa]|uniref:Uncharacterized protein n=1 Tax=Lactuca virosa TaxID=75947 RepID=A0AAU9NYE0_9ASTR|nr:unnamed protein product [Lactuca virosa]
MFPVPHVLNGNSKTGATDCSMTNRVIDVADEIILTSLIYISIRVNCSSWHSWWRRIMGWLALNVINCYEVRSLASILMEVEERGKGSMLTEQHHTAEFNPSIVSGKQNWYTC